MQRRVWSPRGSIGSEHLGQVREGEGWWTGSRSLREAAMPNWELVRRRDVGEGVAEKVWGSPAEERSWARSRTLRSATRAVLSFELFMCRGGEASLKYLRGA